MNPHETKQKIAAHPSPKTKPARRAYRPGWLWFSLALLLTLSAGAVLQPPHPDPWRTTQGWHLTSLDGWRYPVEYNAFKRLPVIHGALNSVHARPNGREVWAVGEGSLIVHSSDGGAHWEQQYPPVAVQPTQASAPWLDWLARPVLAAELANNAPNPAYPDSKAERVLRKPSTDQALQDRKASLAKKAAIERSVPAKPDTTVKAPEQPATDPEKSQIGTTEKETSAKTVEDQPKSVTPPQTPQRVTLNGIYFADDTHGWAVGDSGTILATRDGGAHWTPQKTETPAGFASVYFVTENQGWVVGAAGVIFSTTDGGEKWTKQVSTTQSGLRSVFFSSGGQKGWAVGEGGTILATIDGGKNWGQKDSDIRWELRAIQFLNDTHGWAVGAGGVILVTSNGGESWELQSNDSQVALTSVHFIDEQHGWAVGWSGRILATEDGGKTWNARNTGTENWYESVHFADLRHGWLVGTDGTILATTDGGLTWTLQSTGSESDLQSVYFSGLGHGWALGTKGTNFAASDEGARWTPQSRVKESELTTDVMSVMFVDAQRGWAVGKGADIFHTIDGGRSWGEQTVEHDPPEIRDFHAVAFADPDRGWLVGKSGVIYATPDGGRRWQPQKSTVRVDLMSVHFVDGKLGWAVGDEGNILATADGGANWKPQTSGTTALLRSVYFVDDRHGWTVGDDGKIIATINGGANWKPQTSTVQTHLRAVRFVDVQHGWAVGDNGVIVVTANGGADWKPQPSRTQANLRSVYFVDARHGCAVGDGHTILLTRDGGSTWSDIEYQRLPAPWYYLGLAVCLLAFVRGFAPPAPVSLPGRTKPNAANDENHGAAGIFVSDQPWKPGDPDHLGHGALAVGLSRFLRNENTEPGLTLAITGSWGSGKSSIMKRLQHDLEHAHFRPAWFNAWHHQQEGRQLASMFSAMRRQAIRAWYTPAGFWLRIRLLWARGWGYRMILGLTLAVLVVGVGDAAGHEDMLKAHWRSYVLKEPQTVLTQTSLEKLKKDGALNEADLTLLKQRAVWQVPAGQGGCTAKSADRNATACVFESPGHLLESLEKSLLKRSLSQEEQTAVLAAAHHLPPAELFPHLTVIVALLGPLLALLMGKGLAVYGLDLLPWVRRFLTDGGAEAPKAAVGTLEHYRREFELLTHALKGRLVLFIDDLDRCTPETVREVLELVNYLVSAGQCFIVLGMAMEHVEACIEPKDKTQNQDEYAKQYLKKLINIEAPVPLATAEGIGKLLEGFRARASKGAEKKPGHTAVLAWLRRRGANESVMNLAAALSQRARSAMNIAWSRVSQGLGFVLPATPPLALCAVLAWGLLIREAPKPLEFAEPVVAQASVSAADRGNSGDTATAQAPERKDSGPVGVMAAQTYDPAKALRLPLGFVGLVALSSFWLYGYRKELFDLPERTVDSDEFVTTLDAWRDIIRLGDPTPRGVKRFVNRARLFSMQVEAMRMPDDEVMRESVLVGLAALHHLNEGLVEHTAGFSMRSMDDDARRSLEEKLGKPWKEIGELIESVTVKLSDGHGGWAPTEAECRAFLSLARGVYIR
ncbi:YCF48-related protein [Methylococcus sp. EFPC2]|uniref:YCF48-related protein n=1 Tax=Methylococcus sp. EFPC2 TaxID=2812648 RepID=UPI001967D220|nr:YCF48-related protein [Methylococcus sp. EFPC2]QSA97709.1 hypothetical protein JWZ97_02410 [Methylococcus sp. EFPC2]